MNKGGILKVTIIAGLIVAIISIFILTPLSEKIFKKDSSIKIIEKAYNSPNNEKTNLAIMNEEARKIAFLHI